MNNVNYSANPEGYGKLTEVQAKDIQANKGKIEEAKAGIVNLLNVEGKKLKDTNEVMQAKIKTVSDTIKENSDRDKSHPPLTDRQKEILSKFKKESENIKKEMIEDLKTFYKQYEKVGEYLNKNGDRLDIAKKEIEILEKKPGFGQKNALIGKLKQVRVEESRNISDVAKTRHTESIRRVEMLMGVQNVASKEITRLENTQTDLTNQFKTDLKNAGDLHQSISYVQNLRQELLDDVGKKDFESDAKELIKGKLDALDGKIKELKDIEKEIGGKFTDNKSLNEKLAAIKTSIDQVEDEIGELMEFGTNKTRNWLVALVLGDLVHTFHNYDIKGKDGAVVKWPDRPVIAEEAIVELPRVGERFDNNLPIVDDPAINNLPPPLNQDVEPRPLPRALPDVNLPQEEFVPFDIGSLPPPLDPDAQPLPPPNVYVQQEESVDINSLPPPLDAKTWLQEADELDNRIAQSKLKTKETQLEPIKEDIEKTKVLIDKMRENDKSNPLLAAIQAGKKLRKTVIEPKPEIKPEAKDENAAELTKSDVLNKALEQQRKALDGSLDSGDNESDDWDDIEDNK